MEVVQYDRAQARDALAKRLVRQIRVVSNPSNRIQYYNICLLTCLNQLLYLSIVQSNNVNKN